MAMKKKEQAAMQAAIDRAEMLAALRWTGPVKRDVEVPLQGYSEGWDYDVFSRRVWQGWIDRVSHGEGRAPITGKFLSGSQGSRGMFWNKARALSAMRHELEKMFAAELMKIDREIEKETQTPES